MKLGVFFYKILGDFFQFFYYGKSNIKIIIPQVIF